MLIEWALALVCYAGAGCEEPTVTLSPAAASVAACESGDTVRRGTLDWDAVNVNADGTRDYGAFQFNDHWVWSDADRWFMNQLAARLQMSPDTLLSAWPTAADAPPAVQVIAFEMLWNDGQGSFHWSASQKCWESLMKGQ
jgi:hypothetical protein